MVGIRFKRGDVKDGWQEVVHKQPAEVRSDAPLRSQARNHSPGWTYVRLNCESRVLWSSIGSTAPRALSPRIVDARTITPPQPASGTSRARRAPRVRRYLAQDHRCLDVAPECHRPPFGHKKGRFSCGGWPFRPDPLASGSRGSGRDVCRSALRSRAAGRRRCTCRLSEFIPHVAAFQAALNTLGRHRFPAALPGQRDALRWWVGMIGLAASTSAPGADQPVPVRCPPPAASTN